MKKKSQRYLLLLAAMLLLLVGSTAAAFANQTDMQLIVNGKSVTTDVSPVIVNSRMLIPARAVFEAAGATVSWEESMPQYVGIRYGTNDITLTIGSTSASVNGQIKTLDVPAQIVNNRTLIPVRFAAENLGFQVGYDDASRVVTVTAPTSGGSDSENGGSVTPEAPDLDEITGISFATLENSHRVTITADAPIITHTETSLTGPYRFVADIKGFAWSNDDFNLSADKTDNILVTNVRAAQFTEDTVRIVTDLTSDVKGTVSFSSDKKTMYIDFAKIVDKKPKTLADVLIVIDPGHGGPDPGSQGKENGVAVVNEKDVNLDVAVRLNQKLQAAGLKTKMTRTGDTYADPSSANAAEDLHARANMANSWDATLCIAIHNNSAGNITSAKGTETLYYDTDGKALYGMSSKELATRIQKNMVQYCGTYNRGPKERPELGMLRLPNMPAVIVEGAFVTNAEDRALMQTDAFRENYARAVADAVIQYLNEIYPQ